MVIFGAMSNAVDACVVYMLVQYTNVTLRHFQNYALTPDNPALYYLEKKSLNWTDRLLLNLDVICVFVDKNKS